MMRKSEESQEALNVMGANKDFVQRRMSTKNFAQQRRRGPPATRRALQFDVELTYHQVENVTVLKTRSG